MARVVLTKKKLSKIKAFSLQEILRYINYFDKMSRGEKIDKFCLRSTNKRKLQ